MNRKKTILIVEDELKLLEVLVKYFKAEGFEVFEATDGKTALSIFQNSNLDLVILDVMIPKIDGFEVAKRIRSNSNIPIIIMTALGEEQDMAKGYNLNIDDYITKPFPPKILVMKVNSLFRRIEEPVNMRQTYEIGNLKLDFGTNQLFINSKEVEISKTEFKLLAFLIQNKDKACSRSLLLDEVWGLDVYVDNRIVDTYIKNIRKILKPFNYIKTVFGIGYQFVDGAVDEKN